MRYTAELIDLDGRALWRLTVVGTNDLVGDGYFASTAEIERSGFWGLPIDMKEVEYA